MAPAQARKPRQRRHNVVINDPRRGIEVGAPNLSCQLTDAIVANTPNLLNRAHE